MRHDGPDEYLTVAGEGELEAEITRSRFICSLAPVVTEAEAKAFLARVRARHPDATHHCSAWVVGADAAVQRADDDGEPGGTAGAPMLRMLLRREVRDTVAVVTRYFGGTKLGAGGLVRAYGGVVGQALDAVGLVVRRRLVHAAVTVGHDRAGRLHHDLAGAGHDVTGVSYGPRTATVSVRLPAAALDDFRAWLADATAGTARLDLAGEPGAGPA